MVKDGWIEDKKKGKRKREWKRIALVRVLGDESHRVCNNFVADRSTTERRLFFCRYIYICFFFFFFFHASRIDSPFFHSCEQLEAILAIFVLFCFFFFFSCDWSRFIQHDYRIVERKGIVTRDFLPSPLRISNATFLDVNHTIILSLFIGRTEPMLKRCCWFKRKKEREKKKMNKKKKAEETKIFFTRLYL